MYSMKKIIAICALSVTLVAGIADADIVSAATVPYGVPVIHGMEIMQTVPPMEVPIFTDAKITLNKTNVILIKGQTLQLKLSGTSKEVQWSSSNESVATVTSSGKVKAKAKGTAEIRAKVGSKIYTCTVTVETPKLNKTSLSVVKGKTAKLKLSGTNQEVKWSSSDQTIAKVSSAGKVRGIKAGECEIVAKIGSKKYVCKVVVTEPEEPEKTTGKQDTESQKETTAGKQDNAENACPTCGTIYKETVFLPSLSGAGYTLHSCEKCKTSYKDTYVDYNPTGQQVYEAITALREQYPDGTPWTNGNYYSWKGGIYSVGYGCAGFAFLMSDAAFGYLPARMHTDYSDIRVGDILRINNNTHSVIVLEVSDTEVTIAEGNFNSSVFWGRKLSRASLQGENNYIMTRYPEQKAEEDKES